MPVYIGAIKKSFSSKKELIAEIRRLLILKWIAESKVQYEKHTGIVLNPQQGGASTRLGLRIARLKSSHKDLISEQEFVNLANETYQEVNNLK